MKICFVCNEYPPGPHGGIGTFTQVVGRGLVNAGHSVSVVGVYPPNHPAPDYEVDQGVRVWRMREPKTRLGQLWGRWRLYRAVADLARAGEIEVVEAPDWEGWTAGWKRLPIPVVVRLHGSVSYFARELGAKPRAANLWVEGSALRGADDWSSVSVYTAGRTSELFGLKDGPAAVLYNPVETKPATPFENRSATDVVFSGTLTEKKGVVQLARAWPAILQRAPGATLHLYGKDGRSPNGGSMQRYLLDLLPAESRASWVFHGHVGREELLGALTTARAAIFPSYAEAFALAPLEAMACGCPTIYSTKGSGPELITDGVDGLLCDPDVVGSIEQSLVEALTNKETSKSIGAAGRRRIESRFSLPTLIRENEAFFRSCIDSASRAAGTTAVAAA